MTDPHTGPRLGNQPATRPGRLFIFGLGYSALALAGRLLSQGWQVAGTTRTPDKAAALERLGISAHLFGPGRPLGDAAAVLGGATHLLATIPPDRQGGATASLDPVLAAHVTDIARLAPSLAWVGYLSTTGVYGDTGGAWVDETSPLTPSTERGHARLAAEQAWLGLWRQHGVPVHLFRLPGIYGPGRSTIDSLRDGTARRIDKPGQVFGRIHVEDIATTLAASMARPNPSAAYNVADDEPAASPDVIAFAAGLLGMPTPPLQPFDPARMSPMAASFYAECKRVRNDRIKTELGVRLAYPTYREGLRAQLAAEAAPGDPGR